MNGLIDSIVDLLREKEKKGYELKETIKELEKMKAD